MSSSVAIKSPFVNFLLQLNYNVKGFLWISIKGAKMTIAAMIYAKTGINKSEYLRLRGFDTGALRGGYVSKKLMPVLDADGIDWRNADDAKISGGGCGVRYMIKKGLVVVPGMKPMSVDEHLKATSAN